MRTSLVVSVTAALAAAGFATMSSGPEAGATGAVQTQTFCTSTPYPTPSGAPPYFINEMSTDPTDTVDPVNDVTNYLLPQFQVPAGDALTGVTLSYDNTTPDTSYIVHHFSATNSHPSAKWYATDLEAINVFMTGPGTTQLTNGIDPGDPQSTGFGPAAVASVPVGMAGSEQYYALGGGTRPNPPSNFPVSKYHVLPNGTNAFSPADTKDAISGSVAVPASAFSAYEGNSTFQVTGSAAINSLQQTSSGSVSLIETTDVVLTPCVTYSYEPESVVSAGGDVGAIVLSIIAAGGLVSWTYFRRRPVAL